LREQAQRNADDPKRGKESKGPDEKMVFAEAKTI